MQTVSGLVDAIVDRWSARLYDDTQVKLLDKKDLAELRDDFYTVAAAAVDAEVQRERNAPLDDSPEPPPLMDPRMIEVQREMLAEVQKQTAEQKAISEAARAAMSDQPWISDASSALNGILVSDVDGVFGGAPDVAKLAYDYADAMREERERRKAVRP